ncbi:MULTISPECIES: B12-binding domain-containing radical SAM protein [Clostridium]|uniref:B12-binding domain-containing radical SAM protein n=1 Tax=Clostridium TaxID=1485 RepID=UPI0008253EA2|nr:MULTISPECIES: radical SAM protein [Clostridium]PJI06519.1 hypothetical protein CUB90_00945 [Clostridium sp. CT7]
MNVVLLEWRPYSSLFQRNNLGLQYIAASLRSSGHNTSIYVFQGDTLDEVCNKIISHNPHMVAITLFPETKDMVYSIFQKIKEIDPNIVTVTGGHTATLYASKVLRQEDHIDIITYGESELTYVELCNRIDENESIETCRGIFYRKDGYIMKTKPREEVKDLDALPFPVIDVTRDLNDRRSPTVFTSISTSRGCLGNCAFCVSHRVSKVVKYSRWRGKSAKGIIDELKYIRDNFPDKRLVVEFVDSSFEDNDPREKKRIKKFLDLLEASNIKMAFSFLTRAESWSDNDNELIARMKKLGLFSVSPGFESGADDSLMTFGKRATVANNYKTFEMFSKNGVDVCGMIIMFHPYVTFKDLRSNAEFLLNVGLGYSPQNWIHSLYVFPDTRIFQRIVSDGLLINDNKNEFTYSYSFKNGKIEKMFRIIEKIGKLDSVKRFDNTCEKILYELRLYEVWKHQSDEFENVEIEMSEYKKSYKDTAAYVSNKLYEMFLEMIEKAEKGDINDIENEMVVKWDRLLTDKQAFLEHEWMRYRIKLLRKDIQLL